MKNLVQRVEKTDVQPSGLKSRPLPGKKPLWENHEGEPPPPEKQKNRFWSGVKIVFSLFSVRELNSFREKRGERYKGNNNFPFTF